MILDHLLKYKCDVGRRGRDEKAAQTCVKCWILEMSCNRKYVCLSTILMQMAREKGVEKEKSFSRK